MEKKNGSLSSSFFTKEPSDRFTDAQTAIVDHASAAHAENGEALNGHAHANGAPPQTDEAVGEVDRYEPGWRPFPLVALPLTVRQYVVDVAQALMVDPAAVALPALVAIAGCIGNSRVLKLKSTWTEPAIIFGCVIGEPSSRKTAAMRMAMLPVKNWNGERMQEYIASEERYKKEFELWKVASSKDPEAALTQPKAPARRRLLIGNITVETFIRELQNNPRGLLVARDELRGWFASFGQYAKSGAAADECFWLEVFMGDEYHYDRKTGESSVLIRNLVGSVFGTIQPQMWRRLSIRDMFDSGMMARILPIAPPSFCSDFDGFEPDAAIMRAYDALLVGLINLDYEDSLKSGWRPKPMVFTDQALQLWKRWNKGAKKDQHNAEGEIAAMLGKMEAYCARFSLLFATCDRVTRGEGDIVEEHHVASAVALYEWFREEAERVYAMADMTADDSMKLAIVQKVRSLGGSITPRDLWCSNRRRWIDSDRARRKLMELAGLTPEGLPLPGAHPVLDRGKRGRFYLRGEAPSQDAEESRQHHEGPLQEGDYNAFMAAYRQQFLRPSQNDSFVLGWQKTLSGFGLLELLAAIEDLAADPRRLNPKWPGLWPENHCPFLVELAQRRRKRAQLEAVLERSEPQTPAGAGGSSPPDPDFSWAEFSEYLRLARKRTPNLHVDQARADYLAEKRASAAPQGDFRV